MFLTSPSGTLLIKTLTTQAGRRITFQGYTSLCFTGEKDIPPVDIPWRIKLIFKSIFFCFQGIKWTREVVSWLMNSSK